jgi:hypothetical protein
MDIEKYKKWNEFDWELELQLEDKKINAYTGELSNFIDLPNETEVMWKHLNHIPSLSYPLSLAESNFGLDDDIDDELFFEDIEEKSSLNFYLELGSLASDFSRIIASSDNNEYISTGVQILGLYGSIISKTLDIVELEENEMPALKTALCKRIISKTNVLVGRLRKIIKIDTANIGIIKKQITELLKFREKILDIRYKCELSE